MDAVTPLPRRWLVRDLGRQPYEPIWRAMQAFTDARDEHTPDEVWLVEHEPVFTLGPAGKWEHVLLPGDIPVVPVDRGRSEEPSVGKESVSTCRSRWSPSH